MAKRTQITKTLGPIHFEDLDPHRFEDLVRELIYDFKDWQGIEATGRSGNDAGQDIRAFEKATPGEVEDNLEGRESLPPVEGNRWVIQCKREKEIGPKKLQSYLGEINQKDPPYGYILAAAANFSKESYDVFRTDLRALGVMEFHLWGKAELEDMLHLPKNDRILFTFFGISLVSRRRSRATELRSAVSVKNKLFDILPRDSHSGQEEILVRDLKDTRYPYRAEYMDFDKRPRWREYILYSHHPRGILTHNSKHYAYINRDAKQWDFTDEFDLLHRSVEKRRDSEKEREKRKRVSDVWDFLPRAQRGYFTIDGFIPYSEIAIVDKEGDNLYEVPHLYVDFESKNGPFRGGLDHLLPEEGEEIELTDEWKRVRFFPKQCGPAKGTKFLGARKLTLGPDVVESIRKYDRTRVLFASDDRYDFLKTRDVVEIEHPNREKEPLYIKVTSTFSTTVEKYLDNHKGQFLLPSALEKQLGRSCSPDETVTIIEFEPTYRPAE